MEPPKKYVRINGIMKMNPEFKKWKEAQSGGAPATTVRNPDIALPIVTNMEDHEELNDAVVAVGGAEVPLAESTNATIEMMQEPEICQEAGMMPEEMVDKLGAVLNKYEVPMGLMNKLMMLTEYEALEFIVDDSGSMSLTTDALDANGRSQTRWQEAEGRLVEMLEILAYVPFNTIAVIFLNRPDVIVLQRNGRAPEAFLSAATVDVRKVFKIGPSGTTPALEKLKQFFDNNVGKNIARYFFGDGIPNGGDHACKEITRMLINRPNPSGTPVTFLSCTNEDSAVEWMKDTEEVAPYCSEADDFVDESNEVIRDQGLALPFSKGFYIVCCLVAAMNPDDLDAMDESVPLAKQTLDNLLGVVHNDESYRHYFTHFLDAQRKRVVESTTDQVKKAMNWETYYQEFLTVSHAHRIPGVQQFKQKLVQALT